MPMEGITTCAVPECAALISGYNNLCDRHRLPGWQVRLGNSLMTITAWYAEHGDEVGIIVLNDWALGTLFSRREGFEAKLSEQGFTGVRNIGTLEELATAKHSPAGKKVGPWGGPAPWLTQYPWEVANAKAGRSGATGEEHSDNKEGGPGLEWPLVFGFGVLRSSGPLGHATGIHRQSEWYAWARAHTLEVL